MKRLLIYLLKKSLKKDKSGYIKDVIIAIYNEFNLPTIETTYVKNKKGRIRFEFIVTTINKVPLIFDLRTCKNKDSQ